MMITTLMMMIKCNIPTKLFYWPYMARAPFTIPGNSGNYDDHIDDDVDQTQHSPHLFFWPYIAHMPFTTPGDDSDGDDHYHDNKQNDNAELFLFSDSSVKMSCA